MEKYNGNQKGFIYVSCDPKDRDTVFAKYLEPLAKDGISFWWADDFGKKEEKTSFDAKKAAEALLGSDEFKGCALEDPGQIEFEFDITLEDTKEFYMTRANGLSANMFIIAVAKKSSIAPLFFKYSTSSPLRTDRRISMPRSKR